MSFKIKFALVLSITLWASAFVGIRAGLTEYSPEGLALLRYFIASLCMAVIYYRLPQRNKMPVRDRVGLILVGAIGIGVYNLTLNHGELVISSGMASFITSQSPIITTLFAVAFLGEQINRLRLSGFLVSILGIGLIAAGEVGGFKWDVSLTYIFLATFAGSCYTIMQKPYLKKYHAIEATTYVIWGGTLFLALYAPKLQQDFGHVSAMTTLTVIYLGIFPAAVGYLAWGYVLSEMPVARAASFLYFLPFVATLMGWLCLGEVPQTLSIAGGLLAVVGVGLVNRSYTKTAIKLPIIDSETKVLAST